MENSRVFISYRRADCAYISDSIYRYLCERFPRVDVFRDVEGIIPGTTFAQRINEALSSSNVMLVLIGNEWADAEDEDGELRLFMENDFVRQEIETGIRRGIPIIPVLFERAELPASDQLPESMRSLPDFHWVRLDPEPDFSEDLKRLRDAVAAHLPKPKTTLTGVVLYSLLLFPMRNGAARLAKAMFYVMLFFAVFAIVAIAFPDVFNVGVTDESQMMTRLDAVCGSLLFVPMTAACHWLTTKLNEN